MIVTSCPDVPLQQVTALLRELFGASVDDVLEVRITPGVCEAVVYARDSEGQLFLGADRAPATHLIRRKVVQ